MAKEYLDKAGLTYLWGKLKNVFLQKTTYEYNNEIAFGSSGKLLIGKFPCYDTNVTIEINSTTNVTYHATAILATQNVNNSHGGTIKWDVYGDANNTVTPNLYLYYPPNSRYIEIYFSPLSWSKNLIHIQCQRLTANPTNICENISEIPSTAITKPTNVLIQMNVASATKVNGHTVNSDVPSDAKFTDTTYTPASATPKMDGTGAVGTSAKYAREDHVHPSDTSRVPTTRKVNGHALSADITLNSEDIEWADDPNLTIDDVINSKADSDHNHSVATTSANGFLPKLAGGTTKYLRADGTWATPSGGGGSSIEYASGTVASTPTGANSYKNVSVSFGKTFSSAPNVVVGLMSTSTAGAIGSVSVAVVSVTTTSFTVRFFNAGSSQRAPAAHWIAMGA